MKRWSISPEIFCSLIGSTNYWRVIAKTEMEANNHKVFVMKEWRTAFYLPNRIYNRSVTIGAERCISFGRFGREESLLDCVGLWGSNAYQRVHLTWRQKYLRVSLKITRMGSTMYRNGGIPLSRIKFSYQFISLFHCTRPIAT